MGHVVEAAVAALDQRHNFPGQFVDVGWGQHLIVDDTERLVFSGGAQHSVHEVAALSLSFCAIEPAGANDKMSGGVAPRHPLPGQFRQGVHAEGAGGVVFDV